MALPRTTKEILLVERNPHAHSVVVSYLGLRRSLGLLALAMPIILGPIGFLFFGIEIQDNMSSYYYTPMRDIFVGVMCAMGIFLYCYHGYDSLENWTGNLACVSAIGIALCPLDEKSDPLYQSTITGYIHSMCGGMFFFTLAIFSLYHFPRGHFGLRLKTPDEQRDGIYFASGATLVGCMFLMGVYLLFIRGSWREFLDRWNFLFWMEWIAVWAFGVAWLVKGQALLADTLELAFDGHPDSLNKNHSRIDSTD
jgi:hypothetical protein